MKLRLIFLLTLLIAPLSAGDLDARGVSVNDTKPDPGDLITVSWMAINRTGKYIGSSDQAVVLSTDTRIGDGDDVRLGVEGLGPLGGVFADSSPEVKTVRIPSSVTRGRTYYIGVIADYNDRRDESNESNNSSPAVAITIRAKDLYATDLSINDSNPDLGDLVTVSWTARSRDDTPVGASDQAVMLSTDATIDRNDTFLEIEPLGALGGVLAASTRELRTITIPNNLNVGQTYYLGVIMDYNSEVAESNESNNTSLAGSFTPRGPDLKAEELQANSAAFTSKSTRISAFPGDNINLEWTARNIGGGATDLFDFSQQGVRWSSDAIVNRNDRLLEREPLGIMLSGQSSNELRTVEVPDDATIGETYYIAVEADTDREFAEEDEANNFSNTIEVTILNPVMFSFDLSDYGYHPYLEGDGFEFDDPRLRDRDGDGDEDPFTTMTSSRCFNPSNQAFVNLVAEMDSDYATLFNLTEEVRFTASFNTSQSTSGLTSIGSLTLRVGQSEKELNIPWTVPANIGDYYLYLEVEVKIAGTWRDVTAEWLDAEDEEGIAVVNQPMMVRSADPIIVIHGWSDKSGENFGDLPILLETTLERPVRHFFYETSNVNNAPRVDEAYREFITDEEKPSLADQLQEFLDSPEDSGLSVARCDVIAHSMGGLVARNYALQEKKIRRLITLGTPSYGGLFADTLPGQVILNNQAKDLEYGALVTWKLHQKWSDLAQREELPRTLTVVGTNDFGLGAYNQSDTVVTCSSASLENLGARVYYVPLKHSGAFGPIGIDPIAKVLNTGHPSWDPIVDFLTSAEATLADNLPGHQGGADDVGNKDHPDPLRNGAIYLVKTTSSGNLLELNADGLILGHQPVSTGITTSGLNSDTGIYAANIVGASSQSLGSRFYREASSTIEGTVSGAIRVYAGQTKVYTLGSGSREILVDDLDGDFLRDSFERRIMDANLSDGISLHSHVKPGDDFDLDGLSNLIEAALSTDPTQPDYRALEVIKDVDSVIVRYPDLARDPFFKISAEQGDGLGPSAIWNPFTTPGEVVDGKVCWELAEEDQTTFFRLSAETVAEP